MESLRSKRPTNPFVHMRQRVPQVVAGTSDVPGLAEQAAAKLTERMANVTGRNYLAGEAIEEGLRLLMDEMERPDFVRRYVEREIRARQREADSEFERLRRLQSEDE